MFNEPASGPSCYLLVGEISSFQQSVLADWINQYF
jgi:hypothetical protein